MRSAKLLLLQIARAFGLFAIARLATSDGARIICYHGLWLAQDGFAGDSMFMDPKTFEGRLGLLRRMRFPVVPLADLVDGLKPGNKFPRGAVVITIDDGWSSTYQRMLPALRAHGMSATLYCDTANLWSAMPVAHMVARHIWMTAASSKRTERAREVFLQATDQSREVQARLAATTDLANQLGVSVERLVASRTFEYMSAAQLRAIRDGGIDVQLHTHNHSLRDHSAEAVRAELEQNQDALCDVLGVGREHLCHFCYPSGVTSTEAVSALRAFGIASASTTAPGLTFADTDPLMLPRFVDGQQVSVLEFEAEICGFMELLRSAVRRLKRVGTWSRRGRA